MAINLLGASDALVSYGDVAGVAGSAGLTVSLTVTAAAWTDGFRIVTQWGDAAAEGAFIIATAASAEILFAVRDTAIGIRGVTTTDANIANGATSRIVCRWANATAAPATGFCSVYVNGVAAGTTDTFTSAALALGNSANAVQVGRETDEAVDGLDASYSEFSIHNVYMNDDYSVSYGKGYSPAFFRRNGLLYSRMTSTTDLTNLWAPTNPGVNTSGTTAAHPSMLYPSIGRQYKVAGAVVAAQGRIFRLVGWTGGLVGPQGGLVGKSRRKPRIIPPKIEVPSHVSR